MDALKNKIAEIIKNLYGVEVPVEFAAVPAEIEGDYSCNVAMRLAKAAGKAPREIAAEIIAELPAEYEYTIAGPGFINIGVSGRALFAQLDGAWNENYGYNQSGAGKVAVSEFPSTNMAKPYSVGHLRPGTQGWAAKRILEANGWKVITDNHLGDAGTPFGIWATGFKRSGKSIDEVTIYDLGEIYIQMKADMKAEAAAGEHALADAAQDWLLKLEAGDAEAKELSERFNKISLDHIHGVMKRMDLVTDYELGESFFVERGKELVKKFLAEGKFVQNEDGSVICPLDEFGIEVPMLMLKSNGAALYATTDLACLDYRLHEWKADRLIYAVGAEQKFYFEQLFAVAKKLGWNAEMQHVWFGTIDQVGEDGKREKMSSRKGVVLLEAMLDDAEKRVRENFAGTELSDEDVRRVAVGAIKYSDFIADRKTGILYDPNKIFALTGQSGPFCQYACVRMRRILEKNADFAGADFGDYDFAAEKTILRKLLEFPGLVAAIADNLEAHRVAGYCFELAQELNRYYENAPITSAEPAVKAARLWTIERAATVLERGLDLLGIQIPDKM
ncbi:arginine--tRNA ligase [Candidatus Saccharibacteria bacterium]|nr:arginine--tRNA ligase [Candidatus Saccharibacteria bacterium]